MNRIAEAPPIGAFSTTAARLATALAELLPINLTPEELSKGDPARLLVERAEAAGGTLLGGQVFGPPGSSGALPFGVVTLAGRSAPTRRHTGARGLALLSTTPTPVPFGGRQVGWTFEDDAARYGYFPALLPPTDAAPSPESQTRSWFDALDDVLAAGGFSFDDVVRTWFFLDGILDWYDGFNRARNAFFDRRGVFGRLVPASTGVGAANPFGTALCADVLCLRPSNSLTRVAEVGSPLQCAALQYRSSFSRAVEIRFPSRQWLMVSGTASIAPGGETAHKGQADAQVALTMEVLAALLASRGCHWSAVSCGVAYLRGPSVEIAFDRWLGRHDLAGLPLTKAVCEICRDDLLFEVELDAVIDAKSAERRSVNYAETP
jgi:enamine deaminase RidA (YjgF/YER057c/UK114 family)